MYTINCEDCAKLGSYFTQISYICTYLSFKIKLLKSKKKNLNNILNNILMTIQF